MKIQKQYLTALGALSGLVSSANSQSKQLDHPNVIIVLTDDQGYGDFACHGNPYLKTPNLDKLHNESICFTDFHVAPMSSPTRGQLLTGVDCLRNGCMATCVGRSTVREEYPMAPEIFASAGYQTAMFGKWHVGCNWPHRPMDRGFQNAEYFLGFGLTDIPHIWNSDYFDPYYFKNGDLKKAKGYCNDFWFGEAMSWMKECKISGKPFFCYLPTNLAHFPEWVDSSYSSPYKASGIADYYGMIASIDENVGKLENFLKENELRENTILIFLTDNGTVHKEIYNAGMTGGKCTRTEGGHRVPCFVSWPNGKLMSPSDIQTPAQVQDILPTLIDLCKIKTPSNAKFDGTSLTSLLRGGKLADRMFVVQYYQSAVEKYDAAVVWNYWRLLYGKQLFDIHTDLAQKNDVSAQYPEIVAKMKSFYEQWWKGVEPRINDFVCTHIGNPNQEEVNIYSTEWQDVRADGQTTVRQPKPVLSKGGIVHLMVEKSGTYTIEFSRWPREVNASLNAGLPAYKPRFGQSEPEGVAFPIAKIHVVVATKDTCISVSGTEKSVIYYVNLNAGRTTLQSWFSDAQDVALCGAFYVFIKKKE
jgi:arylsulfatase A-like enzyme